MRMLWGYKEKYKEYSAKRNTISATFSSSKEEFLCYERKYEILEDVKLTELLRIARENNWTALDLTNCGLNNLPDELWDITSLKVLYLGNTFLDKKSQNNFEQISEKIGALVNLEALSICNVPRVKIPKALKTLPNLTYLDCFGCDYQNIPDNVLNKNIRGIGINCIDEDQLSKICKIRRIEEIFLTGSPIERLPCQIANLKHLRMLYLRNTRIEMIPDSLMDLKQIKSFEITGTPLAKKIPEAIRKQTAIELIAYICKQQSEISSYYFNESKMIVVGQGNVGKSCLVERITENKYEEKESTEGIDVKKWTYNIKKKQYSLNIWDFGGQEIYHSTHQFFLTKRSLYIFVWDARAEEEYGRIDYWLKTIESFADDSPIIIAINKCDEKTTRVNRIDLKEYQKKYPQIRTVLDISCKDNINIQRLRDLIRNEASNLPITKEKWLKSWYNIRVEIEKLENKKRYISIDEYLELCKKYGVEYSEAKSLSKYLHDLGIILHYQDDNFLRNIVILSPEWATSAVYKILDSQETILKNRNGILFVSDLPKIWNDTWMYPEDKYVFLLKIMEKFQLCFEVNKETYLVAELLENTSIDCPEEWTFDNNSCICFVYQYDFMPAGVMTRFITKIHNYIASMNGKDLCWKKGVYLRNKTSYARVILEDSISEKKIEVRVSKQGNSLHGRELLCAIRETLKEINATFSKIKVEEYVPCNCSPDCSFKFPYSVLCAALDKKILTIQCYESFKEVNVLNLLEGIEVMRKEEINPYTVSIQNNPVISNSVSIENSSVQTNNIDIKNVRKLIMEMQGDLQEIKEELFEKESKENDAEIREKFEKINQDLECIEKMETSEEVIKSGKLNKLKRLLMDFSDENSDLRRLISGGKNVMTMLGALALKFNGLAEMLGVTQLPPI